MDITKIYHLFTSEVICESQINEDFCGFSLSFKVKSLCLINENEFQNLLNSLFDGDDCSLFISYEQSSEGVFNLREENILIEINEKIQEFIDEEMKPIIYSLKISKTKENSYISIYSIKAITYFLRKLSIKEVFNEFNELLISKSYCFYLLNDEDCLRTNSFVFSNNTQDFSIIDMANKRKNIIEKSHEITHKNDREIATMIPEDFFIKKRAHQEKLNELIDRLCVILCFSYLANYTEIVDDNIFYKIAGHKSVDGRISKEMKMNEKAVKAYFNIYSWVYNSGSVSDKCGIARNVISLYINKDNVNCIDEKVYESILSCNEMYLTENINQYIEVKNNVISLLNGMNEKFLDIANSFSAKLRNTIIAIISFYFTTVLLNALSTGSINNIFTKEIAILSYAFIFGSTIYFFISLYDIEQEIKQYIKYYKRQKKFYEDILNKKDIENIFLNDKPFEEDLDRINVIKKEYSIFWVVISIILLLVINVLAKYSLWTFLSDLIESFL